MILRRIKLCMRGFREGKGKSKVWFGEKEEITLMLREVRGYEFNTQNSHGNSYRESFFLFNS